MREIFKITDKRSLCFSALFKNMLYHCLLTTFSEFMCITDGWWDSATLLQPPPPGRPPWFKLVRKRWENKKINYRFTDKTKCQRSEKLQASEYLVKMFYFYFWMRLTYIWTLIRCEQVYLRSMVYHSSVTCEKLMLSVFNRLQEEYVVLRKYFFELKTWN